MRVDQGLVPIRSYSLCFRLERRIHKLDRWRIPLSYGIPLAAVGWAIGALLVVLVASQLPVVGVLLSVLHPALRLVALPVAVAWFLSRWRIDGRPPLAAAGAYTRWRLAPRRITAFRPMPEALALEPVTLASDGRGARLRRAVVKGPARVVLRYPVALRARRGVLRVTPQSGQAQWRGKEIRLRAGQRMVIGR